MFTFLHLIEQMCRLKFQTLLQWNSLNRTVFCVHCLYIYKERERDICSHLFVSLCRVPIHNRWLVKLELLELEWRRNLTQYREEYRYIYEMSEIRSASVKRAAATAEWITVQMLFVEALTQKEVDSKQKSSNHSDSFLFIVKISYRYLYIRLLHGNGVNDVHEPPTWTCHRADHSIEVLRLEVISETIMEGKIEFSNHIFAFHLTVFGEFGEAIQ